MLPNHIDTEKVSNNKLRRFKSQNQVIYQTKNIDMFIKSPSKLSKHSRLSKSRSKSKMIENKLFANAKKVDNKATLLTSRSTMSQQSNKVSNLFKSNFTRSVSKKSSLNPTITKRIKLKNIKSQQFTIQSTTQQSDHQLSILINEHTTIMLNKKLSLPFIDDNQSSINYFDNDLEINSQIEELNQSVQNDLTLLKMVK